MWGGTPKANKEITQVHVHCILKLNYCVDVIHYAFLIRIEITCQVACYIHVLGMYCTCLCMYIAGYVHVLACTVHVYAWLYTCLACTVHVYACIIQVIYMLLACLVMYCTCLIQACCTQICVFNNMRLTGIHVACM